MIQGRNGARLSLKAFPRLRLLREMRRKDLDSHLAVKPRVTCAIDLSHAACAQRRSDFIRAEACAGRNCHRNVLRIIRSFSSTWTRLLTGRKSPPRQHRSRHQHLTPAPWSRGSRPQWDGWSVDPLLPTPLRRTPYRQASRVVCLVGPFRLRSEST